MTVEDIQKSIKASLYERVSSPLIGTFIFSWCLINWRILGYLFFNNNTDSKKSKIELIENYINHNTNSWWILKLELFFYPLISSIIIITVIPYFTEKAFKVSQWYKARKINIKLKSEDKTILSLEESIKLRLKIRNLQNEFNDATYKKDEENSNLIQEHENLNQQIEELQDIKLQLEGRLTNLEEDKLHYENNFQRLRTIISYNEYSVGNTYDEYYAKYYEKFNSFTKLNQQKLKAILKKHNTNESYVKSLKSDINTVDYLLTNEIIYLDEGVYTLTEFGKFISMFETQYFIPRIYPTEIKRKDN